MLPCMFLSCIHNYQRDYWYVCANFCTYKLEQQTSITNQSTIGDILVTNYKTLQHKVPHFKIVVEFYKFNSLSYTCQIRKCIHKLYLLQSFVGSRGERLGKDQVLGEQLTAPIFTQQNIHWYSNLQKFVRRIKTKKFRICIIALMHMRVLKYDATEFVVLTDQHIDTSI